ncbi:DoxX family protein [Cellulosimicrobium arenosum]|uniref:DoxX family protein n=1 Tax=Cellulosimicrobium arenosum TaxID=2708133 RepID=A0A927IYU9_9MICO|nr:DoxX family protein [Cellulosimicrobium arenosum]MBD8077965.1 DoxX family protein [Cellulosimicrobium arenosum]
MPIPLPLFLVLVTGTTRALGALGVAPLDDWRTALCCGLAALFLVTASGRLVPRVRADLVAMVPPRLPAPGLLVALTGALEALGAVGLLVPATSQVAAVCLALLLVVMTPANVWAARHGGRLGGRPITPLGRRLTEQALYLVACAAAAGLPA